MSNALLNAVWPLQMPMARKFVLVALADYANDSGICFPSVQAIAMRCAAGERTVQENLRALEADGYVSRQFSKGRATTYRITDPRTWRTPAAAAPVHEPHPSGADDDKTPPQQPHPTPAAAAPEPLKLNLEKELPTTSGAGPPADPIFGAGLQFLMRKGNAERSCRGFLGKLRQTIGDDLAVAVLLATAERDDVSEPLAWLAAAAKARKKGERNGSHRESAAGSAERKQREGDEREARAIGLFAGHQARCLT